MYIRAIVDELGYVVVQCDGLDEEKIIAILMGYPDYIVKCIEI